MYKVILEIFTGDFKIVHEKFNVPKGFINVFSGSKPACKAWVKGHEAGRNSKN
jgi:hypothetical protein